MTTAQESMDSAVRVAHIVAMVLVILVSLIAYVIATAGDVAHLVGQDKAAGWIDHQAHRLTRVIAWLYRQ